MFVQRLTILVMWGLLEMLPILQVIGLGHVMGPMVGAVLVVQKINQ